MAFHNRIFSILRVRECQALFVQPTFPKSTCKALKRDRPCSRRSKPFPSSATEKLSKAFIGYKKRHGMRRSPLPDFFIGAHAAIMGLALLTRDARRYRSYFPSVRLISAREQIPNISSPCNTAGRAQGIVGVSERINCRRKNFHLIVT